MCKYCHQKVMDFYSHNPSCKHNPKRSSTKFQCRNQGCTSEFSMVKHRNYHEKKRCKHLKGWICMYFVKINMYFRLTVPNSLVIRNVVLGHRDRIGGCQQFSQWLLWLICIACFVHCIFWICFVSIQIKELTTVYILSTTTAFIQKKKGIIDHNQITFVNKITLGFPVWSWNQ